MNCDKCQKELREGMAFCPSCGSKVEKKVITETEKEPVTEVDKSVVTQVKKEVEVKTEKTKKQQNKFLKTFLSVILCILVFAVVMTTAFLCTLRESIKEEKISNLLDGIDVGFVVENSDINKLMAEDITNSEISKIYRKGTFKDYIESTLVDYSKFLLNGETPKGVSGEDIVELVEDNADLIAECCGKKVSEKDYREIEEYFDENQEGILEVLSSSVSANPLAVTAKMLLSVYTIIIFVIITLLLILLLLKIRKSYDVMLWTGSTFLVSAVTFGIFGIARFVLINFLAGVDDIVAELVNLYLANIFETVLITAGILLLTGIILIVAYVITKNIMKARKA